MTGARWPNCDCAECMQRRYDEQAASIHFALTHDAPAKLSSVKISDARLMSANQKRALLGLRADDLKANSKGNANK